jgi:predicted ATPase
MIRQLHIENFKGFAELTLDFASLTLLSGLNGTGKSSIIQTLLLLRQSWLQGMLQEQRLALNGDLVQIGTARDALYSYAEEDNIRFRIRASQGDEASWTFAYDRDSDVLRDPTAAPPSLTHFSEHSLFSEQFQYLCAERTGPRTAFATSDYVVRQQHQLGTKGEYTAHFLSVFGSSLAPLEAVIHPQAKQGDLTSQVEAWLGDISPGTKLSLTPHTSLDLVQLQYQFTTGSELTDYYRSTNVGFGLTYALPIVVAVLAARPGALLLIENPEAHLHPRGQRRMGELLAAAASAGVQIVAETHSDHALNGVRLSVQSGKLEPDSVAIHFFSRTEEHGQTRLVKASPAVDRNGRISDWPDGFFDEWDSALAQLLKPSN